MISYEDLCVLAGKMAPMHVMLDEQGRIHSYGTMFDRIRQDKDWYGVDFFEIFEVQRPRSVSTVVDLLNLEGEKLHLAMRTEQGTRLKAVLGVLPDKKRCIINFSFGISVVEAVRDYGLTSSDFSPTDLTVEMLYLVEANSAAMAASRQLNLRLQGAKIAAEEQAFTDTLTGLKNRRAMDQILSRLLSAGRAFSLMHMDLDFFKQINDTLGHAAGDAVLQRVASIMVEATREGDTVARVGGDEFVLIFEGFLDRDQITALAKRLITRIEEPIHFGRDECRISASAGTVLSFGSVKAKAAELLNQADAALYAAKRAGRAQHVFYRAGLEEELAQQNQAQEAKPGDEAHSRSA